MYPAWDPCEKAPPPGGRVKVALLPAGAGGVRVGAETASGARVRVSAVATFWAQWRLIERKFRPVGLLVGLSIMKILKSLF